MKSVEPNEVIDGQRHLSAFKGIPQRICKSPTGLTICFETTTFYHTANFVNIQEKDIIF